MTSLVTCVVLFCIYEGYYVTHLFLNALSEINHFVSYIIVSRFYVSWESPVTTIIVEVAVRERENCQEANQHRCLIHDLQKKN